MKQHGTRRRVAATASPKPLPQFDAVAVRIADLGAGIGVAHHRTPDDIDALFLQVIGVLRYVVDYERDHAIAEMLQLWRRIDRQALICDQLDDRAAKIEIDEVER